MVNPWVVMAKTVESGAKGKTTTDETPTQKKQRQAAAVKSRNRPFEQKNLTSGRSTHHCRKPVSQHRVIHVFAR